MTVFCDFVLFNFSNSLGYLRVVRCCVDSSCADCEMSQHGCPERLSNRSKAFQDEGPSQPTMEVLVETLTGTAFEMTVSPSDTIFAIKSKIFRVEGEFNSSVLKH